MSVADGDSGVESATRIHWGDDTSRCSRPDTRCGEAALCSGQVAARPLRAPLLGALPHLPALALQAAGPLLLPLPAELGPRLLIRVRLVSHPVACGKAGARQQSAGTQRGEGSGHSAGREISAGREGSAGRERSLCRNGGKGSVPQSRATARATWLEQSRLPRRAAKGRVKRGWETQGGEGRHLTFFPRTACGELPILF